MRHHSDDVYVTSQPIGVKVEISLFYRRLWARWSVAAWLAWTPPRP